MCPKCFLKIAGKPNNYQFYLPNFLKFCENILNKLLRPSGNIYGNSGMVYFAEIKLPPSPLLNVAAHWKSSNTEVCAKNLFQILADNTNNGGRWIRLRIYAKYCRFL